MDFISEIGSAILTALARVGAGLLIAAWAMVEMAVISANTSQGLSDPLQTFFVYLSMAFGVLGVTTAAIFVFRQFFR